MGGECEKFEKCEKCEKYEKCEESEGVGARVNRQYSVQVAEERNKKTNCSVSL